MTEANCLSTVPTEGNSVRVTNTETGDVLVEDTVTNVEVFDNPSDEGVYLEINEAPGQTIQFKTGVFEGEEYSWARRATDTMGVHDLDDDCWSYEIVEQ